mmetsp:Transcript_20109/g.20139  ORF Transcript_20109/g.20139 Transcript_20109/m.20139 type:complete len:456 (+) Transcript_20109:46-1413(+)
MLKSASRLRNACSMMKFATNFNSSKNFQRLGLPISPDPNFPYIPPTSPGNAPKEPMIEPSFDFEVDPKALLDSVIRHQIYQQKIEEPFIVADLGDVMRKHHQWITLLPRVKPYYAVKCNSDMGILKTLASLGTGFDCASTEEIKTMIGLGVEPENIIFANPCKAKSNIRYARDQYVNLMTADCADELHKIHEINPNADVVIRIYADDSKAVCRLGKKFGIPIDLVPELVQEAKEIGVNIVGISFHVGSGCTDATAYSDALLLARKAFNDIEAAGYNPTLLDIGGGFPGYEQPGLVKFDEIASVIRPVLDELFPRNIKVIAEPGRYYVASAFSLSVNVTSKKEIKKPNAEKMCMYYVNDGVYGSFNNIMFDHAVLSNPHIYKKDSRMENSENAYECSIWGPTCDSMDCLTAKMMLPELEIGDWLSFSNMGAYTVAAASTFNGFAKARLIYVNSELE